MRTQIIKFKFYDTIIWKSCLKVLSSGDVYRNFYSQKTNRSTLKAHSESKPLSFFATFFECFHFNFWSRASVLRLGIWAVWFAVGFRREDMIYDFSLLLPPQKCNDPSLRAQLCCFHFTLYFKVYISKIWSLLWMEN